MNFKFMRMLIVLVLILSSTLAFSQSNPTNRQVVLQGFWWDYWHTDYPNGWANYLAELAPRMKELGIDAVWIPPTIKNSGTNSVGYAPFDHYDLGDKHQKGNVKTRVGDKDELLRMVAVLKANGIDVIQDIVLNHVSNAGSSNGSGGYDPQAPDDGATSGYKNFRYVSFNTPATQENTDNYLSRSGRFPKNWQNFYPNNNNVCCSNEINTPYWGPDISYESDAFGQSSNAIYNPAQSSEYTRTQMRNWLIWYKKQVGWDGVRIDAIKHFPGYAAEDFLWNLQWGALWANGTDDMFAVGEWVGGASELDNWADEVQNRAGTFDFALRNGITDMVSGSGFFDIGTIPNYQQQNRQRTVPFVNNHDTYRPILDGDGNYTGFDQGSQLGMQVEPNDPRSSVAHAIALSVDGAPEIFFEDLFNIGYLGNRFNHDPTETSTLPSHSDIENLLWCHQNLHFKSGEYFVPWQAADALVIERGGQALIGMTDHWDQWQNLVGVQTTFADGTVLYDYSGANGSATQTVYGGGLVDISIPPCDGSAEMGRKGYCVWAPENIDENYSLPGKRVTQEWEMANDLGDSHISSLQQGGALPNFSLDCRLVGKIFPNEGDTVYLELYPENQNNAISLFVLDKECNIIDSVSASGPIIYSFIPSESNWYSFQIRNATETQSGQKCWLKANYLAPQVVDTGVIKNKCACEIPTNQIDFENPEFKVFPNPTNGYLTISGIDPDSRIEIISILGSTVYMASKPGTQQLDISWLASGRYFIKLTSHDTVHVTSVQVIR